MKWPVDHGVAARAPAYAQLLSRSWWCCSLASPTTAAPADSAAGTPITGGPQLLEADGNPLDSAVADQVRSVYTALQRGDLASIRVAYDAAGSA